MAQNQDEINLIIKAQDQTQQAFNSVVKNVDNVKTSAGNLNNSFLGLNKTATGLISAFAGFFAVQKVVGFFKSTVDAMIEAEDKMNLVKSVVEATGQTFASVEPQIMKFAASMSALGRDDETVALITAKLGKALGGDFVKGAQLAKLASDLTASGFGDLQSNADNLSRILSGKGQRALMEYRINLDANATTTEQLDAVMKKVTRTTEQWSETTAGRIAVMNENWTNFKENLGNIFGPALSEVLSNWNTFLTYADENSKTTARSIGQNLADVFKASAWSAMWTRMQLGAGVMGLKLQEFINVINGFDKNAGTEEMRANLEKINEKLIKIGDGAQDTTLSLKELGSVNADINVDNTNAGAANAAASAYKKEQDAIKKVIDSLKDYKTKINDIKKAVEDEGAAFVKSQVEASMTFKERLAEMVKDHKIKWEQANKDRQDLEAKINKTMEDLNRISELRQTAQTEYNIIQPYMNDQELNKLAARSDIEKLTESYRKGQAESTVDEAKKIADLKTQAQNVYINFDLTGANITDKDFISKVKDELNKSFNILKFTH
jgi:DNA-binding transcriptional MerR regulator